MSLKHILALTLLCIPGVVFADNENNPLQLVITATTEGSVDGAPQLTATLTNVSDHEIKITQLRGDPTIAYRLTVRDIQHMRVLQRKDEDYTIRPPAMFTASAITLKPGEHVQEKIELDGLYDFTQSGQYVIRAERYIPKELGLSYMISNEIKLEVPSRRYTPKALLETSHPTIMPYDLEFK